MTTNYYQRFLTWFAACLRYWADGLSPIPKKQHHLQKCGQRKNDIWLTPECVARDHIETVKSFETTERKWVDPFKNTGNYYNNFPTDNKDWCEILEGRDALEYDYKDTVVASNPPYSFINKLLTKMATDKAHTISLLVMTNHITTPRLEMMKNFGYKMTNIKFYNIKGYMNTAVALTWEHEIHMKFHSNAIQHSYMKGGFITEGEPNRE